MARSPAAIDLKDVRAFCSVVDARSMTAAAKLLGETKGSISRRIARLERTLGVALLRRSPRLVQPTDEGALYRENVGRALELLDDASRSLEGALDVPRGKLRVTAPSDFAVELLPELVTRFRERCPEVQVEMVASDARLDFDAQQLDCAFRVGELRDSSLKVHRLLEIELGLYASPGYLSARGAPRRPEDLSGHTFVSYTNMPRPFSLPFPSGPVEVVPAITGDGAFVHRVIVSGGGIGGLPRVLAARDVASGALVPVLDGTPFPLQRSLSFLYPATVHLSSKLRSFRDFVLEALARPAVLPRARKR